METHLPFALLLLAQAAEGVSSGGSVGVAGWASFATSGGVLAWLLWSHLPAKDKQLKELIDGKDALIAATAAKHESIVAGLTAAYAAETKETRREFREALNAVLTQNGEHIEGLGVAMRDEFARLHKMHELASHPDFQRRTQAQAEALAEEAKRRHPRGGQS